MKVRNSIYLATLLTLAELPPANAQDCYQSAVVSPSPFLGNHGEMVKLLDGSIWEVKYEYEYMYEYNPTVLVCPSRGKLVVGKKSLNVERVSAGRQVRKNEPKAQSPSPTAPATGKWEIFEETNLAGSISGTVKQGSIFKTVSGNVYEVTGLTLQLVLELQPEVMVLRNGETYKLVVKGFDEPLICRKLN